MRPRRMASSSGSDDSFTLRPMPSTIYDAPIARGSEASTVSAVSKTSTWTTSTSISTIKSCDSFLIPDTDCDCLPSRIPTLEPVSRRSTWDKYLFDTAVQRQCHERDRMLLRRNLLKTMKCYYGHEKWQKVESCEEIELVDRDQSLRTYLSRLVLYGEPNKRRCRYVDRKNRTVERSAFKRRPLGWDPCHAGFFSKLKDRLEDDFKQLKM